MSAPTIDILIKLPEVCRQAGLGKSAIYEIIGLLIPQQAPGALDQISALM